MHYLNQLVFSGKINNVGAFIRENSGKSYRRGIELGLNIIPTKNFNIFANANLSQNKNLNFRTKKNNILEDLGNTQIALSPNFIGNIGVNYQLSSFNIHLQNQYVDKQFLDNNENNLLSIPDYNILDFGASYQLDLKHYKLHLHFNLNNILNRMYMNKGFVYDQTPYYYPQAGRNFMLGMRLIIK